MYIPTKYNAESWDASKKLIAKYPLATVVTTDENGFPIANHIPFFLVEDEATGKKYLHAHMARKNHQVPSLQANDKVLVIFQSANSYISPSYYPEKPVTHKFVPTWDFAATHIYGSSRIVDDPAFIVRQLECLADQEEKDRPQPWKVSETHEGYFNALRKAIYGLEIEIDRVECKFKFEQDMSETNTTGVVEGLAKDGKHEVSAYVKECNP